MKLSRQKRGKHQKFLVAQILKRNSVILWVSPGNTLWRYLRGYCPNQTDREIVCRKFLWRDWLKHPCNHRDKDTPKWWASLHPQKHCSCSHKTSFLWDHLSLSQKTSFSNLNIFVGVAIIKGSKKFNMW